MNKIYCLHGDVSLIKVSELPKGLKQVKWHKGFILEKGEGQHLHTIEDECEIYEKDGVMYLKVDKTIKINHEEHGIQTIEPGIYRKDLEQEFSYEDFEARNVID